MTFDVKKAVADALEKIQNRPYAGRHPELGKMINCPVCNRRHRGSMCKPVYAKDKDGNERIASENTRRGVFGARAFKGRRVLPHHNVRSLQLVQRTQELFPMNAPYITDPTECMRESRKQASRQLAAEREIKAKNIRRRQKTSRNINAGLTVPGVRAMRAQLMGVSTEVRNKRQEAQAKATKANAEAKNVG